MRAPGPQGYDRPVMKLVRMAAEAIVFFFILAAVLGLISGETSAMENVALAIVIAVLVGVALLVRRMGQETTTT